jgi:hypothetical protein
LEALFAHFGQGKSLKTSFELATQSTEIFTRIDDSTYFNDQFQDNAAQHPLLDDNGDGQGSNTLSTLHEGTKAKDLYLGIGPNYDINAPDNPAEIWSVTPTQHLTVAQTSTVLLATVNNPSRVEGNQVIVDIRPPSLALTLEGTEQSEQLEINGLPRTILTHSGSNRFTGSFAQFTETGQYELLYFVTDALTGEISPLKRSFVYKDKAGNNPPSPFALQFPANGSKTQTILIFDWENSHDPENDPITYTLLLATDAQLNNIVYRQEQLMLSMTYLDGEAVIDDPLNEGKLGLRDGTQYYWKVQTIDQSGAKSESPVFSFTTNNTNAPPWIGSIHVSSAVNFISLDNAIIDFYQMDEFGNPILDEFGNPLLLTQPPVIHQERGSYNMLMPPGRRRVNIAATGFKAQTLDFENTTTLIQQTVLMEPVSGIPIQHGQLQFTVANTRLAETQGQVYLLVNRVDGSDGKVSISYTSADDRAKSGQDYTATSGTLTWADQDSLSKRLALQLLNDNEIEDPENFTVLLHTPTDGAELGTNHQLSLTIIDDDSSVSTRIDELEELSQIDEDVGTSETETLKESAEPALEAENTMLEETHDGETLENVVAEKPNQPNSGDNNPEAQNTTSNQSDLETSVVISNKPNQAKTENDNLTETEKDAGSAESQLSEVGNNDLLNPCKTIPNSDSRSDVTTEPIATKIPVSSETKLTQAGVLQFMAPFYQLNEGIGTVMTFTVTRTIGSVGKVSIQYAPIAKAGTALLYHDYVGGTGQLVWSDADNKPKSIALMILDDNEVEELESLPLILSNPTGGAILGPTARTTLMIADNDGLSTSETVEKTALLEEREVTSVPENDNNRPPVLLPNLGNGIAITPKSKFIQEAIWQEPADIRTHFKGGAKLKGQDYQTQLRLSPSKMVTISGEIIPDASHLGQSADILIIVEIINEVSNVLESFLMIDQFGEIQIWDGDLTNLLALEKEVILQKTHLIDIYYGVLGPSTLQIYFGYRLKDNGYIFFNGKQPIKIKVGSHEPK